MTEDKKRRKVLIIIFVLMATASVLTVHGVISYMPKAIASEVASSVDQDELPPMDSVGYCRVRELRTRNCLSDQDLAAIGCSYEDALRVLMAVRNWYQANEQAIDAIASSQQESKKALDAVKVQRSITPLGLNDLQKSKNVYGEVLEQKKQLDQSLSTVIAAELDADQNILWEQGKKNSSCPMAYRYSDVSIQDQDLLRSSSRLARCERRDNAYEDALGTLRPQTLTSENPVVLHTDGLGQGDVSEVRRASEKVFPIPGALKPRYIEASVQ